MIRRLMRIKFLLSLAGAFCCWLGLAATADGAATWTWNAASGDWEVNGNWTLASGSGTPNYTSGDTFNISSNNALTTTATAFGSTLNLNSGGTLQVTGARTATALHLDGGTLQFNVANTLTASAASGVFTVDADSVWSTSSGVASGGTVTLAGKLSGSGNITLSPTNTNTTFDLDYTSSTTNTYTGQINVGSGTNFSIIGSGATDYALSGGTVAVNSGGTFVIGQGFSSGKVVVNTGGTASGMTTNSGRDLNNLDLDGGTLLFKTNSGTLIGNNTTTRNLLTVDANSTIQLDSSLGATGTATLEVPINGSGNLAIQGTHPTSPTTILTTGQTLNISYTAAATGSYTGTINLDSNSPVLKLLAVGAAGTGTNFLNGGNIAVNSGGILNYNGGFTSGKITVNAGGYAVNAATADSNNSRPLSNLHLNGGTLYGIFQSGVSDNAAGDNTANSNIYVDSESTLDTNQPSTGTLDIMSRLNGSGTLDVNTDNGGTVYVASSIQGTSTEDSSSTYTGNWKIIKGTLRVGGDTAGGNSNFALGSGQTIDIASGQTLLFDDSTSNIWDIRHTITGSGTMKRTGTTDTLTILRSNDDTSGGLSPGSSSAAGVLSVSAPLDFQPSTSNSHLPHVTVKVTGDNGLSAAVAGTNFDQVNVTGGVSDLNNAALHYNISDSVTQANMNGEKMAVLVSSTTNFSTLGQTFSVVNDNPHWAATVVYGDASGSNGVNAVYLEDFEGPSNIGLASSVGATIIKGGTGSLGATISNTSGAGSQNLNYTLTSADLTDGASFGAFSPGSTGSLAAGSSQTFTRAVSSTNVGSNTIQFTATGDAATLNSPQTINATLTVLDHSDGEFDDFAAGAGSTAAFTPSTGPTGPESHDLSIDFGTVSQGANSGLMDSFFDILNEITTAGFTADLDVLAGNPDGSGDTGELVFEAGPTSPYSVAEDEHGDSYTFRFLTNDVGDFSATYVFHVSDDQSLDGAAVYDMTLTLHGEVVSGGPIAVPEPSTFALVALGLAGLGLLVWRRRRA